MAGVCWNCASGSVTSSFLRSISSVQAYVLSGDFAIAPASKRSHGAVRALGVRQMIPAFALASLVATSERQREPLSVLEESHQTPRGE